MLVIRYCKFFFLLFHVSTVFAMGKNAENHITKTHWYDKNIRYKNLVKNKDTKVLSVKKNEYSDDRKTTYPKENDKKAVIDATLECSKAGHLLFSYDQTDGNKVEYKQLKSKQSFVTVFVKDSADKIKTAYPALRYISAEELEKDCNSIYLATVLNKDNDPVNVNCSVEIIKKASRDGVFLASHYCHSTGKQKYLVDISKSFTKSLFYGKEEIRGSILVETDWINKKNNLLCP